MPDRSIALRLSVIDAEGSRARLIGLGTAGEEALEKIQRQAPRTAAALGQVDRSVTKASGSIRAGPGQVGFQLQDVLIQVQSGTDPVRALTQQFAQLASAFGPIGIAVGTTVAVLGSLVTMLTGSADAAEEATESTKRMADVQEQLTNLLDSSTTAIRAQAAAISDLAGTQRQLGVEGLHLQLAEANRLVAAEGQKLTATLDELEAALLAPRAVEVRPGILTALAAIRAAAISGDVGALAGAISGLVRQLEDPALIEFQERLVQGGAAMQDARKDADALKGALDDLEQGAVASADEIRTEYELLAGIAADVVKQGEQAQRKAAEEARREAEQQAERDAQFRTRQANAQADELVQIARQTVERGQRARLDAETKAEQERVRAAQQAAAELARQSDAQARAMAAPFTEATPEVQAAMAVAFLAVYTG